MDIDIDLSNMDNQQEKEKVIIDTLVLEINECVQKAQIDRGAIDFIGVGVPGSYSGTKVLFLINVGIKNFDIGEALKNRYAELGFQEDRVNIVVENDGNCAVVGELALGALRGVENGINLVYGTGLGTGFILNGKLYKGENNSAGEMGHMLDDERVHAETKTSVKRLRENISNILNLSETIDGIELVAILNRIYNRDNYEIIEEIDKKGSKVLEILNDINSQEIRNLYETYKEKVVLSLINVVNTFDPKRISIGGSLSYFIGPDLEQIVKEVNRDCYYKKNQENRDEINYEIVIAKLGNDAGIIGAAMLEKYI